jgi:hypothetical protein
MELNQQLIKKELLSILEQKKESILNIQQSTVHSNDVKSSAGDKHETGVAMAHLEQEKTGKQLQLVESMLSTVNKLIPLTTLKVQPGHLIRTTAGWYFLSVGLGKIEVNEETIYCLSSQSPIGQLLLGKQANNQIHWQDKRITILEIL